MSNILGPPVSYIDLLDDATDNTIRAEDARGIVTTPIRPSASGKCTRELYYELMEYHGYQKYPKRLKTAPVKRLLDLGHSIEWHLIKQLEQIRSMFAIRYKQQVLSFKFFKAKNPKHSQWLEGSLDMVLWSDKYRCVADVKSKNDRYDFRSRKMKWDADTDKLSNMASVTTISLKENPERKGQIMSASFWVNDLAAFLNELDDPFFEANFLQLNLYANSEFLVERGIDHAAIIQYGKNDSRLREIRFRPSKAIYESTLKKFGSVIAAVDAQDEKLAKQDYEEGSFKCRYCPYQATCWGKKGKTK